MFILKKARAVAKGALAAAVLVLGPTLVQAQQSDEENLALIIGNFDYDVMEDVPGNQDARRIERALRDAGFRVLRGENLTAGRQVGMSRVFAERLDEADRVMVVVLGHVVSSADDSYLLGVDARQTDVLNAGLNGLSLTALQSLLTQRPGTAILMVAGNRSAPDLGRGLRDGFGATPVKQGVTVVRGRADALSSVLIDGLLEPGNSLKQALPERSGLNVSGFVSDRVSFMGAGRGDEVSPDLGQLAYWNATRDIGSKGAYEAYLRRFPDGIFADEARNALEDLRQAPLRAAQAAEAALNLSRSQRRDVQSVLTFQGFNTRGVDGIFGRGSRAAIASWQEANGFDQTGYLTAPQLRVLNRALAEVQAAEAERREREAAAEAERQQQREAQVQEAWNAARNEGTVRSYRRFIRQYPNSQFAREARRQLAALDRDEQVAPAPVPDGGVLDTDRAEAQERIFAQNRVIRLAVERQLQRNGFDPGGVDGVIDTRTRRAIRAFQRSRGLEETGYLDASTVSLLAL